MSGLGPTQPTWAVQQVVGYLGYTGRGAGVVAKAAFDPEPTCAALGGDCDRLHSNLKFNSRIARPYSSFCLRMIALKFAPHIPTG